MSWYKNFKKSSIYLTEEMGHISEERKDFSYQFAGNKHYETDYFVNGVFREFDNSFKDPYLYISVLMYSMQSGNTVYKKQIYFKPEEKKEALTKWKEIEDLVKRLRQEQEANNIPTATLPNMLWYTLQHIHGNPTIKPTNSGNIVYLRTDPANNKENKGDLFQNMVFLNKAQRDVLENSRSAVPQDKRGLF